MRSRRITLPLSFALLVSLTAFAEQPQVEVVAKSARVKVRQETIATVKKGEKYRLLKTDGAWTAIVVGEGEQQKRGWVLSSAVRPIADPAVSEDSAAPNEPAEVRISVDLVQCPQNYGPQTSFFMKVGIANESGEPLQFKVEELSLKVDDQPLTASERNPNVYLPVYTDASMTAQAPSASLSYLKDTQLAPGAVAEGWLAFSLASMQQELSQPGALGNKNWIIEGKVGPHKIRLDLKDHEIAVLGGKVRPSTLDPSVQAIEVGPRLNALNIGKLLEGLRSIPADERGCVIVLKNRHCLFDGMATQQFQQQQYQIFQMGPNGNAPVVSTEGENFQNQYGFRGYFSYGQLTLVPSEAAGVLTILGRRLNTGEILVKHLGDKAADIRAAAAKALTGHLIETGVIKSLATAADDADFSVRVATIAALGGTPASPGTRQDDSVDTTAVVKAMGDADATVRMTAAQTAQNFPCDRARVVLIKLLDDADVNVKVASANSLGTIKARDGVAKLKQLQSDGNPQLKTAVIDALKNIGELTPVAAALAKLDGGNLYDFDYVELGKAKDKRAVPGLVARLKDFNNGFQISQAAKALGEIGDPAAVEPLIQTFLYGNRNFGMSEVPRAMGKLGDKRAIEPLRETLRGAQLNIQWDLRSAVFEGLLMLKAPGIFEDATVELKRLTDSGQFYAISPLLAGLGHTRDEKAIAVLTPHLANQQTCNAALEGLIQIGTKDALAAIEKQLASPNFQFGQFAIQQRQWTRTPAQIALLKKLAASANQFTRNAAVNALATVQGPAPPAGPPSPIGYFAPRIEADAWVNGEAPKPAELTGKVVVIGLPAAAGSPPDISKQAGAWQQKFGKQGLVVMALWNQSGWDWNAVEKAPIARPEANLKQEQAAVAALAKARGVTYRVGLVAPARGLIEQFGGPPVARFAIVDRAGIVQAVTAADDDESKPADLEPLLAELVAEPSPSATTLKAAQEAAGRTVAPGIFEPAATCWTIPAHESAIWSVKFSPDDRLLATTSEDGTAKLWDAKTGQLRYTLRGHNGNVRGAAFTHDGRKLLTSGFDRTIRVWDVESGGAVKTLTDDAPVYFLSLLGDDRTVISSSSDARVRYWNLTQGMLEGYFLGHGATAWVSAAATVDGKSTIVSGSTDKTAKIWEFQTGQIRHTLSGHELGLTAVAISSDAKTVASGAGDGEVIIWDASTGEANHTIAADGAVVYDVSFSPDNQILAVGRGNHTVTLYSVATGKPARQLNRGGWCVHVSADGKLLASGSDDRTVRIWRLGK